MPTVADLIEPFFAWKQGPNKSFAESSRIKYLPLLESFASWTGERDVSELTTALVEFEYLPAWNDAFEQRNGRAPALNTVRLKHNALSPLLDYAWRRGLVSMNPMLAIPRPSYESPMNDWLSAEEDFAIARVRKTPLEEIVYAVGRLGGLRCAEITGLLRGHVDLSERLLHVRGTKSPASVRGVVIFPELAANRALAEDPGCPRLDEPARLVGIDRERRPGRRELCLANHQTHRRSRRSASAFARRARAPAGDCSERREPERRLTTHPQEDIWQ